MDEQAALRLGGERQAGEEGLLHRGEAAARPGHGLRRQGGHAGGAGAGRRLVMVAEQGERAGRHIGHGEIDHRAGIGAIADEVAEQHEALGAPAAGMVEAGAEGLEIAMHIGQDGEAHAG